MAFPAWAIYQTSSQGKQPALDSGGGAVTMGNTSDTGSSGGIGDGFSFLYTASASLDLGTAYLYHNTTQTDDAKVCVYLDDGDETRDIARQRHGDERV